MSAASAHAFGEPLDLPLVVGVDGSEPSLRAVDRAADEAALRGTSLRLVHASLRERYEGVSPAAHTGEPSEELMAEEVVGAAERRAHRRQPGVKVFTDVLPEEPEYALTRESRSALLLVLGRRGRSGMAEALLGSVGVAVAGHAHCPVIVLPANQAGQARPPAQGRIVLGVGDSPAGSAAVRFAAEEALLRGVPPEAVRGAGPARLSILPGGATPYGRGPRPGRPAGRRARSRPARRRRPAPPRPLRAAVGPGRPGRAPPRGLPRRRRTRAGLRRRPDPAP